MSVFMLKCVFRNIVWELEEFVVECDSVELEILWRWKIWYLFFLNDVIDNIEVSNKEIIELIEEDGVVLWNLCVRFIWIGNILGKIKIVEIRSEGEMLEKLEVDEESCKENDLFR